MQAWVRRTPYWVLTLVISGQWTPPVALGGEIIFATDGAELHEDAPGPSWDEQLVDHRALQASRRAQVDATAMSLPTGTILASTPDASDPYPPELAYFLQQYARGAVAGRMQPGSNGGAGSAPATGLDPQLVREGLELFEISCTSCHDAQRATSKRKSFGGWLATVRRMAAKEDADIPAEDHEAIATYLASLNPSATSSTPAGGAAEAIVPSFTLNGTVSPVYRGTDTELENKGFFPDVWVGLEWQPPDSPVSGRVMVCASCHGESNDGLGVELVEASITLDLMNWLTGCTRSELGPNALEAELKAGRFPVPFGTYYQRSHPGALRTVSLPLMYNMGRRVGDIFTLQPVINMPYADEGANIHLRKPLAGDWSATFDVYAVNGLQNGGPAVFFLSRSYDDNNSNLAIGGRGTIGNDVVRFGGSVASGELQNDLAPLQNYKMSGADVTFRWGELLRASYEYAIRVEDSFVASESLVYGNVVDLELTLRNDPRACRVPKVSLLARYDTLEHRGTLGTMSTERFTWGVNTTLRGGSLLILNHEHWIFDEQTHANVFGLRWTAAF